MYVHIVQLIIPLHYGPQAPSHGLFLGTPRRGQHRLWGCFSGRANGLLNGPVFSTGAYWSFITERGRILIRLSP